jgi:PPK2 family polyphosphate:nucleotide phosphotransferase
MIDLKIINTFPPEDLDKSEIKKLTLEMQQEILQLQTLLLANKKDSVLVILQGMDASGKDGIIRDVFTGLNPTNCSIYSFKKPTELEFSHDFLWRIHQQVPLKGSIQVFNRSHYEDVLIQKVHQWITPEVCQKRYEAINHFETLLENNHTHIIKCYLHVSPEKQLERLTERRDLKEEHYKHNDNDWKEREYWNAYQDAYHQAFLNCNKTPWHIIPADKGWYKSYLVAELLLNTLKKLNMDFPDIKSEN